MANDLWRSINDILGYRDPRDQTAGDWDLLSQEAQGFSISGIRAESLEPVLPPPASPYDQNPDDIIAIQRKNSRPLRSVTIYPGQEFLNNQSNTQSPASSSAQLFPQKQLFELFGRDTFINGFTEWLTKEFSSGGNFLEIQFLPNRTNFDFSITSTSQNSAGSPVGTIPDTTMGYPSATQPYTANQTVIINFDNMDGEPFLAGNGDVFKLPFQKVYITFGPKCPPFKIIAGYNTEIIRNASAIKRNEAIAPAFQGSRGLWEYASHHCTPFSVNSNLSANKSVTKLGTGTGTIIKTLGAQDGLLVGQGVALLWITKFSAVWTAGPSLASPMNVWEIQKCDLNGNWQKTLGTFMGASINSNSFQTGGAINVALAHPIRVCLRSNEFLKVKWSDPDGSTPTGVFAIDGYVYGNLYDMDVSGGAHTAAPSPIPMLTEHPYPMDDIVGQNSRNT